MPHPPLTPAAFDALDDTEAASVVGVWAAITHWVDAVVAGRPYGSADALAARADALARLWTPADLDTALAHHPRIGERPRGEGAEADASRAEQSAMRTAADDTTAAIAAGNAAYERRFGRVFLIRAAGRTPDEMLGELTRRLALDDEAERTEALDQLRQIALLRLRSAVADAPASAL
ncbi:2-oxo-4-hydroxy-4-carboxy-5-ureidoimidazoline decarboxylase [Microbacterium dextranolyticum]|uniref:2-oxo-4-hydroxy-4-carboxy-5-ureidoimidazoline decarboxylase n=1 Tax=Microbacterium dextranolyticum TaxID=36806 RepID=A0A9W6HMT6_9MICO|nr:2-oxo-4-hydroxy-4-carboxy-5-ureidoimidazoline decarboxylase [Microbacterium dextranolyticum]MBM7464401.1 2-oxo-4-hydroxy-4-carboxy-5-ureidoimidazoline decarboxylase [Microbacterium dextranolyticum]GLJ95398.1 OHCU decarboxylase [Microbacterium dextranolyticum]